MDVKTLFRNEKACVTMKEYGSKGLLQGVLQQPLTNDVLVCPLKMCYYVIAEKAAEYNLPHFCCKNFRERSENELSSEEKIADKAEVLEYLTNVMRDGEGSEKDRLTASKQLGKYLGLDVKKVELSGECGVTIYDDIEGG